MTCLRTSCVWTDRESCCWVQTNQSKQWLWRKRIRANEWETKEQEGEIPHCRRSQRRFQGLSRHNAPVVTGLSVVHPSDTNTFLCKMLQTFRKCLVKDRLKHKVRVWFLLGILFLALSNSATSSVVAMRHYLQNVVREVFSCWEALNVSVHAFSWPPLGRSWNQESPTRQLFEHCVVFLLQELSETLKEDVSRKTKVDTLWKVLYFRFNMIFAAHARCTFSGGCLLNAVQHPVAENCKTECKHCSVRFYLVMPVARNTWYFA